MTKNLLALIVLCIATLIGFSASAAEPVVGVVGLIGIAPNPYEDVVAEPIVGVVGLIGIAPNPYVIRRMTAKKQAPAARKFVAAGVKVDVDEITTITALDELLGEVALTAVNEASGTDGAVKTAACAKDSLTVHRIRYRLMMDTEAKSFRKNLERYSLAVKKACGQDYEVTVRESRLPDAVLSYIEGEDPFNDGRLYECQEGDALLDWARHHHQYGGDVCGGDVCKEKNDSKKSQKTYAEGLAEIVYNQPVWD